MSEVPVKWLFAPCVETGGFKRYRCMFLMSLSSFFFSFILFHFYFLQANIHYTSTPTGKDNTPSSVSVCGAQKLIWKERKGGFLWVWLIVPVYKEIRIIKILRADADNLIHTALIHFKICNWGCDINLILIKWHHCTETVNLTGNLSNRYFRWWAFILFSNLKSVINSIKFPTIKAKSTVVDNKSKNGWISFDT